MDGRSGRTQLICIVEDDDAVRKGLSRLMRASGYEVSAFATAEDFLSSAAPNMHACVLMDISLPGMSGPQLQARLRDRGVHVPVIAVSARDDDDTRARARALGAGFFLRKPVDDQALLDAISWLTDDPSPK